MKTWNKKQIKQHQEAGQRLGLIKDEVKAYIHSNILKNIRMTEKDVIDFVKKAYKKHGLVNDDKKEFCIVAFGKNTNQVHYFPSPTSNLPLTTNHLILLDIWARKNAKDSPYADATWMFFVSSQKTSKFKNSNLKFKINLKKQIPNEILKAWKILTVARDQAIKYIKKELKKGRFPRGLDVDRITHDVIGKAGFGHGIKHTIGHSLGLKHPHGEFPGINWREYSPLLKNVGYTIEPGIYLKNFGMRTEIDFYINDKNEVAVTTLIQKEIELI